MKLLMLALVTVGWVASHVVVERTGHRGRSSVRWGPAEAGRDLYVRAGCPRCHGDDAQGATGPSLLPMAYDVEEFRRVVRAGNTVMPAFGESELSDQDIAGIHAYLASAHGSSGGQ